MIASSLTLHYKGWTLAGLHTELMVAIQEGA